MLRTAGWSWWNSRKRGSYNKFVTEKWGCIMRDPSRSSGWLGNLGVLLVDLPPEEAQELRVHTDAAGIDFISLIAPTTGKKRLRRIAAAATGFLYYISITGVTGTAAPKIEDIKREVSKIRKITKLPLAVGFGISNPKQANEIARFADGVVIGSAVVRLINENKNNSDLVKIISQYISEIKDALH